MLLYTMIIINQQIILNIYPMQYIMRLVLKMIYVWTKLTQIIELHSASTHMKILLLKILLKSGNIRGTLIFVYFAQIQQARIQKPAKIFAVPKWQVSICSARI